MRSRARSPTSPARADAAMLVVVTGTGTDVGKTWFTAATIARLRERGEPVAARKPAQSFDPGAGPTDADVLAAATGASPTAVCPPHRWYGVAVAPPMAADELGEPPIALADLARETTAGLVRDAITFVEGAGGPRSPIAHDGDTVDLAAALASDLVVLVADAGLGTINAVRLCAAALDRWPLVVALNRYDTTDDLHRRNAGWLREREGLDVVTTAEALAARLRATR
jgi:dethiobiotin synthetase